VENLAKAFQFCLRPETKHAAQEIAEKMRYESGVQAAVASFHRNLPVEEMQCGLLPDRAATWVCKTPSGPVRLSKVAAQVLVEHLRVDKKKLQLYANSFSSFRLFWLEWY
jgi:hypothetical protein